MPEYIRGGTAAFYQPAGHQQGHWKAGGKPGDPAFSQKFPGRPAHPRGVRLTETGEILFRQVESAFDAICQGEEQLRKVQELGMGHLSIGVSSTLCKYVLLPYLSRFTRENPHIQISISCHLSDHGGVGKRDCGYRAYRGE